MTSPRSSQGSCIISKANQLTQSKQLKFSQLSLLSSSLLTFSYFHIFQMCSISNIYFESGPDLWRDLCPQELDTITAQALLPNSPSTSKLCLHLTLIFGLSGGQSLLLFVVSALLEPEMISQLEGTKSPGFIFTPASLRLDTISMFKICFP